MTRMITILGFCLEGLFCLWLVVWSKIDRGRIAGFGQLLDRAMTYRAARITLVLFWWWVGFHFLVTPPGA